MRITTIPHIYRNVRRWTEIISVLSRYGLADWISRLNIDFVKDQLKDREGAALARQTPEKRIRLALAELGPTFIKLGQLLSTRPDVVGGKLAEELSHLQAAVPADPADVVRDMIESELGQPIEELFSEFDEVPIASASIGQVHGARLKSGESVVVKIQHSDIENTVREDLDVLAGLAILAERVPEFASYRPIQTVAEMGRILRRELDFGREERNLQLFQTRFAENSTVRIPAPYTDLCTSRVLTMERIDGIKLAERQRLLAEGFDLEEIARRGARLYLDMIFRDGFYHADPHPGNLVLLPGNRIGLMDFGMVGRVEESLREAIEGMLLAITHRDVALLTSLIKRVGDTPPELDERALSADLAEFVGDYANQSLDQFDLSGALREMTEIIHRYRIMLPPQAALLLKTLVTLEGTTKLLSPSISLIELLQPLHRRIVLRRISPQRQLRKFMRIYMEAEHLAEILPRRLTDILEQVQAGKFDVHLDHRGLEPSVNRLVLGLLTSALFLGSAVLLSSEVPPLLFPENAYLGFHRISLLGIAGCALSVMLGLRLLRAIYKSGHLDRHD
ncbi:MAG: AarF/UbiB family protein [Planctomycetes bacterium]|nr:AarF/UbiB family protein [Planctomycetota bacterium]